MSKMTTLVAFDGAKTLRQLIMKFGTKRIRLRKVSWEYEERDGLEHRLKLLKVANKWGKNKNKTQPTAILSPLNTRSQSHFCNTLSVCFGIYFFAVVIDR